jgi:hypothetical protein
MFLKSGELILKSTQSMAEQFGLVSCNRLSQLKFKVKPDQASLFVELLKHKVPRLEALKFAQRRHCQYDVTKLKDGPPSHRVLRSHLDSHSVKNNGWTNDPPIITNDPFQLDLRRIKHQKEWINKVLTPTSKEFEKNKRETDDKFSKMLKFYQNMDAKFNLRNLSPKSKFEKIKNLKLKAISESNAFLCPKSSNQILPSVHQISTTKIDLNLNLKNIVNNFNDVRVPMSDLNNRFQNHCRSVRGISQINGSLLQLSGRNAALPAPHLSKLSERKTLGQRPVRKVTILRQASMQPISTPARSSRK